MVEFEVLGPLVVRVNGRFVPLGPRQRILVLALLLARGQALVAARLADLVWQGSPPGGWAATLRSHVHHLRRALADGQQHYGHLILRTERVGDAHAYALHIPTGQVDAWRFEQLLGLGRKAIAVGQLDEANSVLQEALGLWRGHALADVRDLPFALGEAGRLTELRRGALVARVETDIQLGQHHEAIGELDALLRLWPHDEALRRLLVTCLQQAGRVLDAVQACREGIGILLALGLDANGLQSLQQQVLQSTPVPEPPG